MASALSAFRQRRPRLPYLLLIVLAGLLHVQQGPAFLALGRPRHSQVARTALGVTWRPLRVSQPKVKQEVPFLPQKQLAGRISQSNSVQELMELLDEELDGEVFNDLHASAAFTRLAGFKSTLSRGLDSPVVSRFVEKVAALLREQQVAAREAVKILMALAKMGGLGVRMHSLVPSLAEAVESGGNDFSEQEASDCVWAIASLNLDTGEALAKVPENMAFTIREKQADLTPDQVTKTLWATATLQDKEVLVTLVEGLVEWSVKKQLGFTAQDISRLFWSVATLQTQVPHVALVLPSFQKQAERVSKGLTSKGLSEILWALAALKERVPVLQQLLPALLAQVPRVAREMTAAEAAQILRSGVVMQEGYSRFWVAPVSTLRSVVVARLGTQTAAVVADSVYGLAHLNYDSVATTKALDALAAVAPALVVQMTPQDLAATVYGFALQGTSCSHFLNEVRDVLQRAAPSWPPETRGAVLPTVAWAAARLPIDKEQRIAFTELASVFLQEVSLEDGWSLCALASSLRDYSDSFPELLAKVQQALENQGLSQEAVEKSSAGVEEWLKWKRRSSR